jgi:hypothetical protein
MMLRGWLVGLAAALFPAVVVAQPELPPPLEAPPDAAPVVIVRDELPFTQRPLGLWWMNTAIEFAWTTVKAPPPSVRLRPPDVFGRRIPGITLPLGSGPDAFGVGIGFQLGRWFSDDQLFALEVGGLALPGANRDLNGFATGTFVTFPNGPDRSAPIFILFPDAFANWAIPVPARASEAFFTLDVNLRAGLIITETTRIDLLVGYRAALQGDDLALGRPPLSSEDDHHDYQEHRLAVDNTFHGGQIGLEANYRTRTWYTSGVVKLAYGAVTAKSSAHGAFEYANGARFRSDTHASFLPTVSTRLGYRFDNHCSVYAGYNFLYMDRVSRLADAFSPGNSPLQGCPFWLHSVNLGLELRF